MDNSSAAVEALQKSFDARLQEKETVIASLQEKVTALEDKEAAYKAAEEEMKEMAASNEKLTQELEAKEKEVLELNAALEKEPEANPVAVSVNGDIHAGSEEVPAWIKQPWNQEKAEKMAARAKLAQRNQAFNQQ